MWLILVSTALRAVLAAVSPLVDDEAYYWLWAQRLDWSYLDQPPMVAWLIFLGTRLGDHPFLARFIPLLLGAATTYVVFAFGRSLFGASAGLRAAVVFAVTPVLGWETGLAWPESPLFLAWALAIWLGWEALDGGRVDRWIWLGVAFGFGLLSKLTVLPLGLGLLIFMILHAPRTLRSPGPYLAAGVALVLFTPVILWNLYHDWAGFRFIFAERGHWYRGWTGLGSLLVTQFTYALLLFPAFISAAVIALRRSADPRYAYLLWVSAPTILLTLVGSWVSGFARHWWLAPAYLGLTLIVGAAWNKTIMVLASVSAALLFSGFLLSTVPGLPVPGAEERYGWYEAAQRAQQLADTIGEDALIVGDDYRTASQMAYHLRDRTVVYFRCPNRHSVWPPPEAFAGRNGVALTDARWTPEPWTQFADRAEEVEPLAVRLNGSVRTFRLFRLWGIRPRQDCRR